MNFNHLLFRFFLPMTLTCTSATVFAVPAGFESLLETRSEVVDVQFGNTFIGFYPIEINEHSLRFVDSLQLFSEISPFVSPDFHQALKAKLNLDFPVLTERVCTLKPEICDIKVQSILATYNPDSLVIKINIDASWLVNDINNGMYRVADSRQRRAWLQAFNLSAQTQFDNSTQVGLRSSSLFGLSSNAHISIDSSFRNAQGTTESQVDSAYLRNDFDHRWYLKTGKLSSYSVNRLTEGGFNYKLVPSITVDGFQFGTGMHYYQAPKQSNYQHELDLFSATGGKADFYLSGVLVYSQALIPGYNKINRAELPYGSYDVEVQIFEGSQLARTEIYSLQSQGRLTDGETQWLFRVGKIEKTEDNVAQVAMWLPMKDSILGDVLDDVSATSIVTSDYWLVELGLASNGVTPLANDFFPRWSIDGQLLYGKEFNNEIRGWNWSSNINIKSFNLNIENRKIDQDFCGSSTLYTCMDQIRLNLGTSFLGNSLRLGYDVVDRYYDDIGLSETTSYRKSLSFGRNFTFQRVNSSLNATLSQTRSSTYQSDTVFFVSLSLSARENNKNYYSSLAHSRGEYTLAAGLNKKLDNDDDLSFRIEQHDDGRVNFSGNAKKDFNDIGAISGSAYLTRNQGETKESVYLGYSVGFSVDEDGRFTTGRGVVNENRAAIIIENEAGGRLPHSVAGLGTEIDSEARFGKVMYPVTGYAETSYRISESNKNNDEGFDSLIGGTGKRQVFLTPGNILVHKLKSDTQYFYIGEIPEYTFYNKHESSAKIESFEVDSSGKFFIQSNTKIDSVKFLDLDGIVECKFEHVIVQNSIYNVKEINCFRGQSN